jgi:hypothetical protein
MGEKLGLPQQQQKKKHRRKVFKSRTLRKIFGLRERG